MSEVLILGGYGNFGKRIASALVQKNIPVIIAGRNNEKARLFASTLPLNLSKIAIFDVTKDLLIQLERFKPAVVINTCGPFQISSYDVVQLCIAHGIHYIDLADGRDFVNGICVFNEQAKQHNVAVISGASTVPALSSAVIEHYKSEFSAIESLIFGISPGQQAERGLATTQGIMTYVGKPLKPFIGADRTIYGWQGIYRQHYPELGFRWMANCDVPDLDIFPTRYGIRKICFSAGLELSFMHLGLWLLSWLVRFKIPLNLKKYSSFLLKISNCFNTFGSSNGGMHIILKGKDKNNGAHERYWFIIAKDGHGPYIPTIPAIILAEKLVKSCLEFRGAKPCVGMVALEEYLHELKRFSITTHEMSIFET